MRAELTIGERKIGPGHPVYIIAEMSANHNQDYEQAVQIIREAHEAGADAIKLQTYTPDTITLDCDNECFRIDAGTIWDERKLYDLYGEASMPWEWQPKLKVIANDFGMALFSAPFDQTSVEFLERMDVPAYKIASPEIVDLPLLRLIAKAGKPIIMSTGMATKDEIEEAMNTIRECGNDQLALLKCTSSYPALPEEMNLMTIPEMGRSFDVIAGLSDHTLGIAVSVAAVALGAKIIEKHMTLTRKASGPDSAFSLEPHEFKDMVDSVRVAEKALGNPCYCGEREAANRVFRRSLFVVKDIASGEVFTKENVRSIRPAYGLHTRHAGEILGRRATRDIKCGTPVCWDMIEK